MTRRGGAVGVAAGRLWLEPEPEPELEPEPEPELEPKPEL